MESGMLLKFGQKLFDIRHIFATFLQLGVLFALAKYRYFAMQDSQRDSLV